MLVWAHGGLLAARNIPIFMIVAAPRSAAAIQEWLLRSPGSSVAELAARAPAARFNRLAAETGRERSASAAGTWSAWPAFALVAAADLRAASAQEVPRGIRSATGIRRRRWPTLRRDPDARIFTDDEWGDYLIWSLTQHKRVRRRPQRFLRRRFRRASTSMS